MQNLAIFESSYEGTKTLEMMMFLMDLNFIYIAPSALLYWKLSSVISRAPYSSMEK